MALAKGQPGLAPLQRLTLAFLIAAEHHRIVWRVEINSDDVPELGFELFVTRQFEDPGPMRLNVVGGPVDQTRCTVALDTPTCLAIERVLHRPKGAAKMHLSNWGVRARLLGLSFLRRYFFRRSLLWRRLFRSSLATTRAGSGVPLSGSHGTNMILYGLGSGREGPRKRLGGAVAGRSTARH
jgi:hypothetical protein